MIDKLVAILKTGTSEGARKAVETKRATGVYPIEGWKTQHGVPANKVTGTIHLQHDTGGRMTGVEAKYQEHALLWPTDHRNYVLSHTYTPGADKPHSVYSRLTDMRGNVTTNVLGKHHGQHERSTETRASFKTEWGAHRWLATRGIQKPHSLQAIARGL